MLKIEHPKDYLKKKGIDSKVIYQLKEERYVNEKVGYVRSKRSNPKQESSKQQPNFNQEQDSWQIYVPVDNDSLYWSTALAYLIPVKNENEFESRFEGLFGSENRDKLGQIRTLIQNYNPFFNSGIYKNEAMKGLILYFKNLIDNHKTDKPTGTIHKISETLNCKIVGLEGGDIYTVTGMPASELRLFKVGSDHYNFGLEKDIGKKYERLWEIDRRLEEFTRDFALIYKSSLKEYYDRLVNRTPKQGKWADCVSKIIEVGKGGTEAIDIPVKKAAAVVFVNILQNFISETGAWYNRNELKKLTPFLYEDQDEIRKRLVEASANVFQSFENQFVQVVADGSWKRAMEKLAHDAVSRSISYYKRYPEKGFSISSIIEGITLGKSKKYTHSLIGMPHLLQRGHSLSSRDSNHKGFKLTTEKLFEEVGLAVKDPNSGAFNYYEKKGSDSGKYSFRLLSQQEEKENQKISSQSKELTVNSRKYIKMDNAPGNVYYLLTEEKLKEKKEEILEKQVNDQELTESLRKYILKARQEAKENLNRLEEHIDNNYSQLLDYIKDRETKIKEMFNKIEEGLDKILKNQDEILKNQQGKDLIEHLSEFTQYEIDETKIEFETDEEKVKEKGKELIFCLREGAIINIIPDEDASSLSAIKVNYILKSMKDSNELTYNRKFMIELGKLFHFQDKVVRACKTEEGNILIINCTERKETIDIKELHEKLAKLQEKKYVKKIILITKEGDTLANSFKVSPDQEYNYKEYKDKISFSDLTGDSQEKILKRKVTFQGNKETFLNILVDKNDSKSLEKVISAKDLSDLIGGKKIEIGEALSDLGIVKDYYIDRKFNRQIMIKGDFLSKKQDEIFIIKCKAKDSEGIKNLKEIEEKINSGNLVTRYKNDINTSNRFFLLDDISDEGFNELSDKLNEKLKQEKKQEKNIHLLSLSNDGKFTWEKSKGALSRIRKYIDEGVQSSDISEDDVNKDKLTIIAAEPGMGKSTVLTDLARKIKEKNPELWVVKISLNDHTSKLKTANLKDKAIEFLSDIGLETSLEKELFKHRINVQGKIALLFDGFDEISPNYEEKVIELLQVLKNTKVEKLWITTRPYKVVQERLEDRLSVFSYLLKPLLPEEQKDLLRKFWKAQLKLNELDEQRSGVFIDELLDNLPKSIDDKDFMSIPLHASMVAEVFQDNFGEFYNSNQDKPSLLKKLDLIDLYKEFIDKKYIIYCREKKKQDMTNVAVEEDNTELSGIFTRNHQKAALYALFEEGNLKDLLSDNEYQEVNLFITRVKDGKEKTGIIYHDGKLKFVHRTFAEYFVASYFWESFKSVQSNKFEDFVKSTIVKNLIEDDRIQISKFLQLKAKKDFESNIDFPDKQNKLRTLLTKLLDQTTKYDYDGNGKQSTKLLFGIVEFSFSTKEKSNVDVIENNDQLKLLCVSAEMGYIKLVEALETKLNKEFLQKYLKRDKWFYSPLWLAAKNAHLDVLEILVEKFSYDSSWEDKDSNTLVERIFQWDEFDVLRSCLKLDIVDGKPYEDLNHRQELPIVEVFKNVAPSDVIKLLIEKTDSNLVNGFKYPESSSQISPAQLIAVQSLKYGKEITELAIKKGIDFSDVINVLLFEYCHESLNSPINKLDFAHYNRPSFHSDEKFLNLFERIELLLKAGVGYNYKDQHSKTTLQYAEQIHYIHKLLYGVHKLHNQKINKSSNPLGTILKLIIDNVGSSPDFEGYEFVVSQKEQKISLSLNYKDKSYKYNKGIPLLPNNIPKLLFKFYEDSNTNLVESTLDKFRNYITNAKEEIEAFKQYPGSNEILIGYKQMLEVDDDDFLSSHVYRKEKAERYKSLDEYEKDLLERVLNLYIRQDYKINDALKEVEEEVLRLKEIINKLKENSGHYETGEILDILAIKNIDTNEELQDLISKIYECGGIKFLSETWSSLNSIGQQKIMGTLELMFKFADQSSKILELLKKLDDSYKTLTEAIQNKNYQEINSILQGIGSDFIKAVIDGQDDKYGSPLHYAAFKGDVQVTKILLESGANPNLKMQGSGILLSTADETQKDEDLEHKYQGCTPLHVAALNKQLEVAKILVNDWDADVNAMSVYQGTPLHMAVQSGKLDIIDFLVAKGADVNAMSTGWQGTPLHMAVQSGKLDVIDFLVAKGADVNAMSVYQGTPLHMAVQSGKLDVIDFLVAKDANVNAKDKDGRTPLYRAVENVKFDVIDFIAKKCADFNAKLEVVRSLNKADPNIQDKNGKTPLDLAEEKLGQNPQVYQEIVDILKSINQQQKARQQGGKVSAGECLPNSRRKREAVEECLFTWEDVDEFNEEKDEKRDLSKIKIDSEKFISYIKALPEGKQSQLIQLADETGSAQGLVSKLIGNQKVMNHLGRVGKISGMTMHGMMAKNVLADFLNGNYQGVAVNIGFIAGGQGFAKVAEAASLKGLKLAEEGKLLVGSSLKAASPFLARGTSAFVVYDLVNQIKAFKNGTEEALVGVVGDSIYLGVDAAEIGIEVAEAFGVLEGVSSVTGPIGAAIGAVVFVGTDIYMAVKRVEKIDQIIHLKGDERFVEGLRAFIGMKPEQYIEELMEKKQLYNQLVKQGLEYLKQHSDIQSYVFPTTDKLDSKVLLDRKRTGIRWSRARPDDLSDAKLFCLPQGNDEPAPDYGSYLCENAIGIFANKTGDHTLINLGEGKDYAKGFLNSPNIFVVNNGSKEYYGGNKDDIFVLQANYIKGHLSGEGGINTLDTTLFALQEEQLNIQLEIGEIADYFRDNWLKICEINKVIGRANKAETITVSCDGCNSNVRLIDGQSGNKETKDRINIIDDSCDYQMQIVVRPNTVVYNRALQGSFDYLVPLNSSGSAELSFIYGPERFNVNNTFWFAYQAVDIKSIDVKYINVFNRTEHEVKFNFVESNKEFNVTISYSENPAYRLGKSGEIRIGNKGNLYMLENSDKSSEEVIRDYLPVANRVSKMSFFIQSVLSNETVVIGSGNHEVIHSNPEYRSHLVGNGGENVYVIDSETTEVIIHDVDEENSIDTIDLRNVVKKGNCELKVIRSENDLLLKATVKGSSACTVRLKDGVERYNKTHVIVENVPMTISFDNNQWSLKPQPLMFEKDKEIIVVTNQDVEEGSEIITPRKGGNYKFVRSNDNDLMITNAFDLTITKNDLCTITLSKFYETPRMKTLFIKFADKEIILKEHQEEISTARDVNVVKKEHKDQVYNDVFNPEVMMLSDQPVTHRHRHSRHTRHRRSTTSSSTRPTGWINDLFGWVKSSVSGLLSSKPESTKSPISQVDARVDVNGTIMLLDMLIRKVTGQKYVSTADQSISPLEAQGYALNITKGFEKVVEQAGLKSGISIHRLNIDFVEIQKEVKGKIMSGKFNEISGVLKSYVEKGCPGEEAGKLSPKKFDKFMIEFNKGLDVTLNQSIKHNGDGRLEVDGVKEQKTNSGPQSYLSNASVQGHLTRNKVKLIS